VEICKKDGDGRHNAADRYIAGSFRLVYLGPSA